MHGTVADEELSVLEVFTTGRVTNFACHCTYEMQQYDKHQKVLLCSKVPLCLIRLSGIACFIEEYSHIAFKQN